MGKKSKKREIKNNQQSINTNPFRLEHVTSKIITYSFFLLFFLVPLVLTPFNYELFEYNKMMLTYGLTVVIAGSWLIKMISQKEIKVARTVLDIPIILFLLSQIISTVFSQDPHVSFYGYYSRSNGGLLSIISYILLYFAFVTNFPKEKIKKLFLVSLGSGVLVSIYGILEHFGIDKHIWVQDVQNRVFSTLGQPNWLAAYLAVLLPLSIGLGLTYILKLDQDLIGKNQRSKTKNQKDILKIKNNPYFFGYFVASLIFYITLTFTKSRSGFIAFWAVLAVFWITLLFLYKRKVLKFFIILNSLFLILSFFLQTPISQINKYTFSELTKKPPTATSKIQQVANPNIIKVGITGSGEIRKAVWPGAINAFLDNFLIGTGVETFYIAHYKYKPIEHNMTSEWDFLYNKAHNEFLNYAATTGILGVGTYLLLICVFIIYNIKQYISASYTQDDKRGILNTALFSAWLSILITNFLGFSVVIVQLFFYLIPAFLFVLNDNTKTDKPNFSKVPAFSSLHASLSEKISIQLQKENTRKILIFIIIFSIFYFLFTLVRFWYADKFYAKGYNLGKEENYYQAYQNLKKAISLNSNEPAYFDEISFPAAQLATTLFMDKQATVSAKLENEAIVFSNKAVETTPNNVNFWKTRTRVFYALSQIDEKYMEKAKESLEYALTLSPTDPKIGYNLALIYNELGFLDKAINLLEETSKLKADYKETFIALGLFYDQAGNPKKAKQNFEYILNRLDPNDEIALEKIKELE